MIVAVTDVRYSYRDHDALRGVSASFGPGINGLLGPNGAGKTTLLRILGSTASPRSGTIQYLGIDGDPRRHIGFLPQRFEVLSRQTVRRNIEYAAWTRGVAAGDSSTMVTEALDAVDLGALADRRAKALSGGERQRLGIACATVHRPSLIILDEPTVGLDPEQRVAFRGLVQRLGRQATVILSTHIVDDLSHLESEVTVIAEGADRFVGSISDIFAAGQENPVDGMSPLEAGYVHLRSRPVAQQR